MSVCYIMGFVLIASTSRCAGWNQEAHRPPEDAASQAECYPGEKDDRACRVRDWRQAGRGAFSLPPGTTDSPSNCPRTEGSGRGHRFLFVSLTLSRIPQETVRMVARKESTWNPGLCWVFLVVTWLIEMFLP